MLNLSIKYLKSLPLLKFTEHQNNTFSFRCPVCGDSLKSKNKKRCGAYPSQDKSTMIIHCFNCETSTNLALLLRDYFNEFYNDYLDDLRTIKYNDRFAEFNNFVMPVVPQISKNVTIKENVELIENKYLIKISKLEVNHPARIYLRKRFVNENFFNSIYYSSNYVFYINKYYIKDKYQIFKDTDERIVFPIYDINKKLIGFQGRIFLDESNNKMRFLTTKINEEDTLIFGTDKINPNSTIFVLEGIFDSLMIANSIALLRLEYDDNFFEQSFPNSNIIFIYDNEMRNKNVMRVYKKIANSHKYGLFIWPQNLKHIKDFNDLVKSGVKVDIDFILSNVYYSTLKKKLMISKLNF